MSFLQITMSEISQPETICSQLFLAEDEGSARKWVKILQELKKVLEKADVAEKKVRVFIILEGF